MKGIIAVVMLALGTVFGFSAGLLIRDPSVISHPRTLLENSAPTPCLRVIAAAEDMSTINREYLSLVRNSYLPMLKQPSPEPGQAGTAAAPAVDAMLSASQRLADLGDRTAAATARLNQSKVECRSRVHQ